MASKTGICNVALLRMGVSQSLTNVDTDATRESLSCLIVFDEERDFVLRDFPWQRARAYATPTLATNFANPANTDWTYAYRMPADALFIRRILTANGRQDINPPAFQIGRDPAFGNAAAWNSGTTYVIGNLVLLSSIVYECILGHTNQTPPNATYWRVVSNAQLIFADTASATFEYTAQLTDPTQFEAEFISMLAWRLAAALSLSLSRTQEFAKTCLEMYTAEKQQAETRANLEGQKDTPVDLTDSATQDLVNLALLRLGVTKDTTPKSQAMALSEARYVKIAYTRERDFVLRDFPWPWATAYSDPVLFAGDSNTPFTKDWVYAYKYPADAVMVRRIVHPLERRLKHMNRQFQFGGDAMWPVPFKVTSGAFGTITIGTANAQNNSTITINARVYTWKTTLTGAANEIHIGADSGTSATNLAEALSAGANIGVDYGTGTAVSADVIAVVSGTAFSATTLAIIGSTVIISGLNGVGIAWSTSDTTNLTLSPSASLLASRFILSNEPNISVEYTRALATAAEFDAYDRTFSSMLAWRLAADLAPSRMTDPKMVEKAQQRAMSMYQVEKTQAQAVALHEGQQSEPLDAEWIRSR